MLQRFAHANGLVTYLSPLLAQLDLPHGFSTRVGGISPVPFDGLNLGHSCGAAESSEGDTAANIDRNYALLQDALACRKHRLVRVRQVHGRQVALAGSVPEAVAPEADALVTGEPRLLLTIRVADCVPILLADRRRRGIAAVHAGWRGVIAGILPATLEFIRRQFHVQPDDLLAAIGPCIGVEHFEVGPEVADHFQQQGLGMVVHSKPGAKPHVDLAEAVAVQLRDGGVRAEAIDRTDRCTFADRDDFFSHRRDHGRTGRMAAVIGIKN